jgi:predicted DNA-binding transcriptional regulator AlpA
MTQYLTTKQVAERYHVDPVTLWRWEKDHAETGFPLPIRIHRRKLWTPESLDAWDRRFGKQPVATLP